MSKDHHFVHDPLTHKTFDCYYYYNINEGVRPRVTDKQELQDSSRSSVFVS